MIGFENDKFDDKIRSKIPHSNLRQQQIVEEYFLNLAMSVGASRSEALFFLEYRRKECGENEGKSLTDSIVEKCREDLEDFRGLQK